jgi:Ca2+-dependent lipid-binding protein
LAKPRDDPKYPFESTGKQDLVERVRLDKNDSYKGRLYLVAEFIPSLNLKNSAFESDGNELERAIQNEDSDVPSGDEESISSSDEEENRGPTGGATIKIAPDSNGAAAPVKTEHKPRPSTDTEVTSETAHSVPSLTSADTAADDLAMQNPDQGVEMTKEQLLQSQSGIIVFNILSGQLTKKARLEVLLEDGYWPACGTRKARSLAARWDEVGEGFIKELEFGRVWLRLNENDEGEKEDIIGEFKVDAKIFLDQSLHNPGDFELYDNEEQLRGTVKIATKFIPVDLVLEPRESVTNMGVLQVELLDGREVHGADRSGKSDPYVIFNLNGSKVYKSQTKKKTLTPAWNESFQVPVPSRVGADFLLEVFDWNQVEQAKSLGTGRIELADLEPLQLTERAIPLSSAKHGDKGEIRVRMLFRPEMVARSRGKTSTFSTAGRAMTQIGGLPLGAGRGLAHGVGHAGQKAFGLFKRDKGSEAGDDEPAPQPPASQVSKPTGIGNGNASALPAANTALPPGNASTPPDFGSLHVTVVGAKDLIPGPDSVKPYAVVRCGEKEHKTKHTGKTLTPEWDETFTFNIGPDTRHLNVGIFDHKTLGRDRCLGEVDVEIWRHLQPAAATPIMSADVTAELREGLGLVQLRLTYEHTPARSGTSLHSTLSKSQLGGSPSRFSISRRHVNSED